jgi:hypothetical protein
MTRGHLLILSMMSSPLLAQTPSPGDPAPTLWVNDDFVPGNRVIY